MNIQTSKYNQNRSTPINKAYYLSKSELLSWVSSILDLEITNFEQTKTGAVFCQLLDACHPGSVRMEKVNWRANSETDYISNFKIFQQGLAENNIEKPIDINRLANGKQYDLNELFQWIYGYYSKYKDNYNGIYNAKRKRGGEDLVFIKHNYKKKVTKNKIRDNYSQASFSSQKSFNSDSSSQVDSYYNIGNNFYSYRNNNFKRQSKQNNINNRFNNRINMNYNSYKSKKFEILKRNKSKRETKNSKYIEFENKFLHNNQINNNIIMNKRNQKNNKINDFRINNIKSNFFINRNNINFTNQYNNYHNNESINKNFNKLNENIKNNNIIENNNLSVRNINNSHNFYNQVEEEINKNLNCQKEFPKNYYNDDLEYDYEKDSESENALDMTDFYGLNEIETQNLIEEEKNDGDKVVNLKKIIRKLRISQISKDKEINDLKNTICHINKIRNFYLNKLRDIEYLYFNPIIKNSNENKNTILRQILCSDRDSTVYIDENKYAFTSNKNLNEMKSDLISFLKYKSQPQSSKKNSKKENNINNVSNNKNRPTIDNVNSMISNFSSKKEFKSNYINNINDFYNENNEKIYYEEEISNQNHKDNVNDNAMNISKNTNNTSKINYNSETQIDSQIYNNSNYNFDERTLIQNHKFIPVKIIKENTNISYLNNTLFNNNSQNLNNSINKNNHINIYNNINNNLDYYNNTSKEKIQFDYQNIQKRNIALQNGKLEGKKNLENLNEFHNSNQVKDNNLFEIEQDIKYNLKKYISKTEIKHNNFDIACEILNDSLHIPGL